MDVFKKVLLGSGPRSFPEIDKPHYYFLYKKEEIPIEEAFVKGEQLFSLCWPYLEEVNGTKNIKDDKA
jgi:hypothetical protein